MLYTVNDEGDIEGLVRIVSDSIKSVYRGLGEIVVDHKNVALEEIRWSSRVLSKSRLEQGQDIVKRLRHANICPFPFGFFVTPEGNCLLTIPPIVEAYRIDVGESHYLLLDGSHRCFAALPTSLNVAALVISFVAESRPLPCKPLLHSDVLVSETQPKLDELFVDFVMSNFRPVRRLTHKTFRFPSLKDALVSMKMKESTLLQLPESKR